MWSDVLNTNRTVAVAITIAALWIKRYLIEEGYSQQFQIITLLRVDPLLCYFTELETNLLFKQAQQNL